MLTSPPRGRAPRTPSTPPLSPLRRLAPCLLLLAAVVLLVPAGAHAQAPTLVSAQGTAVRTVEVTFSEAVDPFTGATAGNYQVFVTSSPATTLPVSSVSSSGAVATLTLGADMVEGTGYTVRVQNVEDLDGNPIAPGSTIAFTYSTSNVTSIATIQANPGAFDGQVVTIQGQVYIPTNYRGTVISGYIQDSSGRGINVFGAGSDVPALRDRSNIVRLTGTIDVYFTTVEITSLTEVTLISSGNPLLQPVQLSTGAAANAQWEGTFIEVTGTITAAAVSGPGRNYTINDGSGNLDVRVVDTLGVPVFANGTEITARGAGSQFSTTYQVLVGVASDVFAGGGGEDTTPPTVASASAGAATSVTVNFSEQVASATANVVGNYQVFQTAAPGNTVPVSAAALGGSGTSVTLTLGASLTSGTGYTVRVANVQDLAGNAIQTGAGDVATFTYTAVTVTPIATIQANPAAYDGDVVTVEGQVYIPSNYRGTVISGYIQDSSGRGLNVFGNTADVAALRDRTAIVRLTGTIDVYFSTTELVDLTEITVLSTGNPLLQPVQLSTGAAANSQWEGTFIEVTGTISSSAVAGPGRNYTISDGSGNIDVRVVDTLGVPVFANGTEITARGAGAEFSGTFQVLVGAASDVFEGGGGEDTTPPRVSSASAAAATSVTVTFNEAVTGATANVAGNYQVFQTAAPANTVPVTTATLGGGGSSVTLALGASLAEGVGYTVRVSNVQDVAGNPIQTGSGDTATFTYSPSGEIPIATIQANPQAFLGQVVTVRGQVYIPSNYRGSTPSGYIQDNSGRGINLFGSGLNVPALRDRTSIVRVTGTVDIYFTTVEIADLTQVTLISSGNPLLRPTVLSTGAAASSAWEGTYIQVSGNILATSTSGGAHNYTVNDGSGPIDVRVIDTLGTPVYGVGTRIWAAGAGSQFQTTFQVLVGHIDDITDQEPPDDIPPSLLTASLTAPNQVTLRFNEEIDPASLLPVGNYTVFRTANPGETVAVTGAAMGESGERAVLTLASEIDATAGWSITVVGVADLSGNAITAPGVTRPIQEAEIDFLTLTGPPRTFLPRQGETYPITFTVPARVTARRAQVILRVFDLNGRLKKTLLDSNLSDLGGLFTNNRATIEWDGRDDDQEPVDAGAYVVHVLVSDLESGDRQQLQMPVVVATRLSR